MSDTFPIQITEEIAEAIRTAHLSGGSLRGRYVRELHAALPEKEYPAGTHVRIVGRDGYAPHYLEDCEVVGYGTARVGNENRRTIFFVDKDGDPCYRHLREWTVEPLPF